MYLEYISSVAMQQAGQGVILTVLLAPTPPLRRGSSGARWLTSRLTRNLDRRRRVTRRGIRWAVGVGIRQRLNLEGLSKSLDLRLRLANQHDDGLIIYTKEGLYERHGA